jgi:hypothetical protein
MGQGMVSDAEAGAEGFSPTLPVAPAVFMVQSQCRRIGEQNQEKAGRLKKPFDANDANFSNWVQKLKTLLL